MKKISLLIITLVLLISGCAHKKENPWKNYEGKSSAEIYYQGQRNLTKKKYANATMDFAALDALYPFGPYSQQGQMDIIFALYMNGDNTAGLTAADRYIRLYPQDPHIDYVYYMKGVMSFDDDFNWYQRWFNLDPAPHDLAGKRESYTAFNQILTIYPHSIYAPDSAIHMAFIRNMMARKEMHIADFYMERKAYVAAANRASGVVQHFSGSTSIPHALEVMTNAYKGAGLPDLAAKSYQILQLNFPDSPEFKRLQRTFKKNA